MAAVLVALVAPAVDIAAGSITGFQYLGLADLLWRFAEVPGEAFDETGLGTLFLRLAGTVVV